MQRTLSDLLDTDPITLREASQLVLRGVITVSAPRSEMNRGNLAVMRIGKNLFTTPAAIREMMDKCRVQIPPRPSTLDCAPDLDIASQQDALNASLAALRRLPRR